MHKVTIYHNPKCGTSRNVLGLLKHCGLDPEIILYLETPPNEQQLRQLLVDMQISAKDLMRTNVPAYEEYQLGAEGVTDEDIIQAMLKAPILINRPIVITEKGTKLCRPSEVVMKILPVSMPSDFIKEDGEVIKKV